MLEVASCPPSRVAAAGYVGTLRLKAAYEQTHPLMQGLGKLHAGKPAEIMEKCDAGGGVGAR